MLVRSIAGAATAAAALALPVSPEAARPAGSCAVAGYSYAGYASTRRVHAVSATVAAETTPRVVGGHVAAWVGVGSLHGGPNRSNEWLQAGLVAYPGSKLRLYLEGVAPGAPRRYLEIARGARRPHRLAVVMRAPGVWEARVDGRAVGPAVYLVGTERGLRAIATAESWTPGHAACNAFAFSFRRVRLGTTRRLPLRSPLDRVVDRPGGFSATA